jgi:outer membrane protein assembly factor BamB
LALLYERVRRPDLAKPQWASLDWSKVQMTALLEQAAGVAPDLEVWTRLTELRPGDVKAWEKRLNALREAGREKEFRDALQVLLPPAGPVEISEVVREALRTQWFASWGRELEIGLQEGRNLENVLRKVRELLQEDLSPSQRNWVRWFGAAILQRAGRDAESEAWRAQVKDDPTGEVAPAALRALCGEPWPSAESRRLGPMDRLRWKYEPPAVSRVAGLVACGDAVLVLDDRGAVAALDGSTGLLRWRREVAVSFPEPSPSATKTLPLFGDVFAMPDFISDGTRAFLGGRDGVIAIDGATGNLLWEARPGGERPVRNGAMAPVPGRIGLATGDLVVALFPDQGVLMAVDAITGKLRWRREIGSGLSGAAALSTGFAVAGPAVAISGPDGVELYRASTGERVWRHRIAPDGPIRLNGPAEAAPSGGVRHLGFVGKHLFAMEDGVVHELPVDFPAAGRVRAIEGIWLGDGCFETEECVSAGNGTVIRGGKGRLTAWQAATGRKLWETENPAISWTAPVAVTTCWRGTITEERRQGFVLRRCWRPSAVFVAGGVAIAGEQEVIAIGGKETR